LETEQLLQAGRTADAQPPGEAVMNLNPKAANQFLLESSPEAGFDRRTILNLHALLTADLLRDPAAEGALRTSPVGIGRSFHTEATTPNRTGKAPPFPRIPAKNGLPGKLDGLDRNMPKYGLFAFFRILGLQP